MSWTWDAFNAVLGRALDDVDSANPAHDEDVRLDALHAALRGLVAYFPRQVVETYSNVNQIVWPADCYRIAAIVATGGDGWIASLSSTGIGNQSNTPGSQPHSFWVWDGVITLDATYSTVVFYYHAYYPELDVDAEDIPVPVWAREAVVYRAAAHCLVPNLASRARLGAFHDRQDAPPVQNSLIQAADWFLGQFERIMTEHRQIGGL